MPKPEAALTFHLHNRFVGIVEGNIPTINALKNLLIPNIDVRAIVIYHRVDHGELDRVESINYTAIKNLRKP